MVIFEQRQSNPMVAIFLQHHMMGWILHAYTVSSKLHRVQCKKRRCSDPLRLFLMIDTPSQSNPTLVIVAMDKLQRGNVFGLATILVDPRANYMHL